MKSPVTTLDPRYSQPSAEPTPWAATRRQLEEAELTWLVTVRPDGRTPRRWWRRGSMTPSTSRRATKKAANLRLGDRLLLQAGRLDWQGGIDVVVEGRATLTTDETLLAQLAAAWRGRWDGRWGYELKGGRLHHSAGFPVLTETGCRGGKATTPVGGGRAPLGA